MATITFQASAVQPEPAPLAPAKPRAYRAIVYEESGTLAKINGVIYFVSDAGKITEFDVPMANFCTVLGEVTTSQVQAMWDRIAGGAARIACTRPMGRS